VSARSRLRLTIVGSGALARGLVEALPPGREIAVTVAARRTAAARRLAKLRPGTLAAPTYADALRDAQVVVLAVDDRAIEGVARGLLPLRRTWRGVAVLHAAGGLGTGVLRPLARRGASTGVLHPIVPLHRTGGTPLRGAYARIAGSPRARAAARRLAALAGLSPLPRSRAERGSDPELHHAAAALATGDILALVSLAEDALTASGVRRTAARRAVLAAASATLARIGRAGPHATLSGPVVRGDVPRLLRHLRALAAAHPAAAPAHRALSARLADLAVEAGTIDAPAARRIATALSAGARGSRRSLTV
jgi:predicted short-subunit dehydrogenase-like oxidoreductase (DUF2520 family)